MKKNYRPIMSSLFTVGLSITILFTILVGKPAAQQEKLTVRGSGLPVPRFVSLKFNESNLRAGPGSEYPVLWQYRQAGLPLLVDAEFGIWRKVIDPMGITGWMHGAGLSLKRMAFTDSGMTKIYKNKTNDSKVVAVAENNALLELDECPKSWCHVSSNNIKGWVERSAIWGILEDEVLK